MNFKYKFFACVFNFFRILPFKKKEISFIVDKKSSFNRNLDNIKNEFDRRDSFSYNYLSKEEYSFNGSLKNRIFGIFSILNFFLVKSYKLSKSKYIFLNDNFFPLAYMNFDENTTIVQLWHASGAFKRFGLDVINDENIKKLLRLAGSKIDYLVISSENVSKIYQHAFEVDENKILPFGTPRIDYYFDENKSNKINKDNIEIIRTKFEEKYPEIKGKKMVLYAPTFRESEELNNDISTHFDFNLFNSILGKEYSLFFRSHPKFDVPKIKGSIDVSNYDNLQELLLITDILITDYSSVMIEYAVLSKPIIFYPFDLNHYISHERGFYFDYTNVPGPIAKNTGDIIKFIEEDGFDLKKIKDFVSKNYDYLDSNSSKRIVDFLLSR